MAIPRRLLRNGDARIRYVVTYILLHPSPTNTLTPGFGFSFGVFQDYYTTHAPFSGSGGIAVIGTLTTVRIPFPTPPIRLQLTPTQGLMFLGAPFVLTLCRLYPRWARYFSPIGLLTCFLSLLLTSFCATVPHLIGVQGVLFGLGGCFAFCPCIVFMDQWFVARKGLAFGIWCSAAGVGGAGIPPVLEVLLGHVGFKNTLRVIAGIFFVLAVPLACFIKPRVPHDLTPKKKLFNLRSARSRYFLTHQVANIVQACGFYLPNIFLPTFVRERFGASTFMATLTIMLFNLAATAGLAGMGAMTDRFRATTCILVSAVGSALSVFLLWGLATSLPVVYVYCVAYGLFAGCWPAVWPAIMRETSERGESHGFGFVDPMMTYGLLCVGRGLGSIIAGPLSEALLRGHPLLGQAFASYGSGYGVLIIFTGLAAVLSGSSFFVERMHWY
jgi:MFS family permease